MCQFQQVVNVSIQEIEDIIAACAYVFQQTAYNNSKPEEILSTHTSQAHRAIFSKVWASEGSTYKKRLMAKVVKAGPSALEASRCDIQVSESNLSVSAAVELKFTNETLSLELSHDQLYELFGKLDRIQDQLDTLV